MTCCSHQKSPYQLLSGEPHIFEDLLGLKIRTSPDTFFQVNTSGAEILYRTVGELSGVNSNTILLDICCVTGITNCEFHTRRAEKILPQLLKSKEDGQLIVAVVYPAQAGLHKDD
ncbi:tRNA (uracil-5-)-methyltransferase homolog B [Kogia breviceps]|uniref:tRNA (uracil-5-)-methyltransferase homolog B n=1 Tax=Kogia breviceps TaxID=27615 RepID=UPI0034D2963C